MAVDEQQLIHEYRRAFEDQCERARSEYQHFLSIDICTRIKRNFVIIFWILISWLHGN